jgi:2-polyprenyl-3-methyl-5-hydroxy-6-metoxy-1,4-benzoquinol methylase
MLSLVLWSNHAQAYVAFNETFVPAIASARTLLEVGPGHGFLLTAAATSIPKLRVTGLDISTESLDQTHALTDQLLGVNSVELIAGNIMEQERFGSFDAIVISEVLEHLEHPDTALANLVTNLSDQGRMFINVPVNSPAPDHIYLWRHPDELRAFIERHGLVIDWFAAYPMVGRPLEQAIRTAVTCVAIARRD